MKLIIFLFLFAFLFYLLIRRFESNSIYFPSNDRDLQVEADFPYEEVKIMTSDSIMINGWFISSSDAENTMIYFHGNAGNITDRISKLSVMRQFGCNLLIIDYRGYGRSEGRPSEKGLYLDADAAYAYIIKEKGIDPGNVILYGASLGGAVAVDLAEREHVKAVILDGVFSSVSDMVKEYYPYIPDKLISSRFDSLSKIKSVGCPKLFMHSDEDDIVPIFMGEKLFNAAEEPKKMVVMHGAHTDISHDGGEEFIGAIGEFLNSLGS